MNHKRKEYLTTSELPYQVTLTLSVEPEPGIRASFSRLGQDGVLTVLKPDTIQGKTVEVTLPESLACYGEGRYELCLYQDKCTDCGCVEIWFESDCAVVGAGGRVCEHCG